MSADFFKEMERAFMEQMEVSPLPPGWVYDFDFETRYNYEERAWQYIVTARPRMKYKI